MTRQLQRAECRETAWRRWRCQNSGGQMVYAPRDDNGVMPRRIRRRIASRIARQAFRKLRTETPILKPLENAHGPL